MEGVGGRCWWKVFVDPGVCHLASLHAVDLGTVQRRRTCISLARTVGTVH